MARKKTDPHPKSLSKTALLARLEKLTRRIHKLESRQASLEIYDAVTNLYGLNAFKMLVNHHIAIAKRNKHKIFILSLHLDNVQLVKETLGEKIAERAVREISLMLQDSFRSSDLIARSGWNKFAVALFDCEEENIDHLLWRLRKKIEESRNSGEDRPYPLEVSVGVAGTDPDQTEDLDSILERANQMIY